MMGDDFSRGQSEALGRLLALVCMTVSNKGQRQVLSEHL